jgi:hypothetical protein
VAAPAHAVPDPASLRSLIARIASTGATRGEAAATRKLRVRYHRGSVRFSLDGGDADNVYYVTLWRGVIKA